MEAKALQGSNSNHSQVQVFEGYIKMSKFQPIDVKPLYGRKWVTNGKITSISKPIKMRMMTVLRTLRL